MDGLPAIVTRLEFECRDWSDRPFPLRGSTSSIGGATQDPIGSFERIRELYISYLDTAFRIGDSSVADERRSLLRQPGTLATEPLVEPLPRYEWDTVENRLRTFEDIYMNRGQDPPLAEMSEAARRAFVDLVLSGLFLSTERTDNDIPLRRSPTVTPYRHQLEMLARGSRPTTPGVVTSGTGSGKTEAFLLPLFAAIASEAIEWPASTAEFLSRRWWHDADGRPYRSTDRKGRTVVRYTAIPSEFRPLQDDPLRSPFRYHRAAEHTDRPAAMRAIIIYPMNALVEDQLVRLRKALDSREARAAMDEHFAGNRIFFGRYTGATPVTGHHVHPGIRHLLAVSKDDIDGDIYFPDHARAGLDGRVSLQDLRRTELERRQRKLSELFGEMVGLERKGRMEGLGALQALMSELEEERAISIGR